MSDMYSLLAQLSIATAQKNVYRVCSVMAELSNEMQYFNAFQAPVVDEAKKFLEGYLAKTSGTNKEQYS